MYCMTTLRSLSPTVFYTTGKVVSLAHDTAMRHNQIARSLLRSSHNILLTVELVKLC